MQLLDTIINAIINTINIEGKEQLRTELQRIAVYSKTTGTQF